jgi:hypothetical protein
MAILAVLIPYETDTVGDPGAAGVVAAPGGATTEYVYCAMVPGAVADEPLPVSVMTPPGPTVEGVAVKTATGMLWIVTVAVTGALCCPKLSVTTNWNVTVPEVFGTVTGCTGLGVVIGWFGTMATAPVAADVAPVVVPGPAVVTLGEVPGPTGSVAPAVGAAVVGAAAEAAAAAGAVAAMLAASGAAAVVASLVVVSVAPAGTASGAAVVAALVTAGVVGGVGVVATIVSFALVLCSVLLLQGPLIRNNLGPGRSG